MAENKLIKIIFDLPESDWYQHKTESLWAISLGDCLYQIRNVPFYIKEVSYDDVVFVEDIHLPITPEQIVQRSGHSTYRIYVLGSKEELVQYLAFLEEDGGSYERATEHLYAIDVPPMADIDRVYADLLKGEQFGIWNFEEGHCGHKLKK